MPDPSEPLHLLGTAETFTHIGRALPPGFPVLHAEDDAPAGSCGSLDTFTCAAGSAVLPEVVIDPSEPTPNKPGNPPPSPDR
jgi:hypothetical protein